VVVDHLNAIDVQHNVFVAHGLRLFFTRGFKPNETAARKGFIWQLHPVIGLAQLHTPWTQLAKGV
jgi:hypothetical protein